MADRMHCGRLYSILAFVTLVGLMAMVAGCGGDKSTNSNGDDDDDLPTVADYLLLGYIGGDVAENAFGLYISRLEPTATSAMAADVTINGQDVSLVPLGTPEDAVYVLGNLAYESGETYTVLVSIGSRTSTCSFAGPAYPVLEFTAPNDNAEFVPGEPLELTWEYTSAGTPPRINIMAAGEGEDPLLQTTVGGSNTSYMIPGTVTAQWANEPSVLLSIDEGSDIFPFTGALSGEASYVTTTGWGDALMVVPGDGDEPEPTWIVYLDLGTSALEADGASTTTAYITIEDGLGDPCPDNTQVTLTCDPAGAVTFDPVTASTSDGEATSVITAGTTAGDVEITAGALGESAQAWLELGQAPVEIVVTVGSGGHPQISWTPATPMTTITLRQQGGALSEWSIVRTLTEVLTPPITYGTVPTGAMQVYPPLNAPPAALAAGTTFQLLLTDAAAITTVYTWTHAGD